MTDPDDVTRRLTDLEVKLSFMEDLVEKLDEVVTAQQARLDLLVRELLRLRDSLPSGEAAAPRSLRDEIPPHY